MTRELLNWKSKGNYFEFNTYKIFYIKEGIGPVLTLFHGYPYNSFDFEKIWDELIQEFTVVVPDMIGMGFSDKPANHQYSFDEMAGLYISLFKELQITETHILAHDLGNSVVQELLSRNEENKDPFEIKSVAFLNGGLFTDAYKPRFIQLLLSKSPKPIGRILSKLMSKKNVSKATAEVFGIGTKPSIMLLQNFWDILNFNKGKSIAYLIGRLVFAKDKHQQRWILAMQQTKIPMCFINGPADPNSGKHMAERYTQLVPNAYVKLLDENIGHWPQIEAPQQTIEAYNQFLERIQI
ncbi:alpha/beta hydrolase [Pedobacter frigiditerrae]|uniref:alpha/beta fold hydrolase n=1 Tax=Pedobacter frigiditerrae TaxID=2530452 RepID=UPI0029308959|nr:alpha/beta hydrolase [Pedobacter frigiditerrae]